MSDDDLKEGLAESAIEGGGIRQTLQEIRDLLSRHLDLRIVTLWVDQYAKLDTAVTREAVDSMKAFLDGFATKELTVKTMQKKSDAGYEEWIKKLLITQRIYEYLMFIHQLVKTFPSPDRFPDAEVAARRWLRELCWNREFHLVHIRQARYYPEFTKEVNKRLLREARRADSFVEGYRENVDEEERKKSKQMIEDAKRMRECVSYTSGSIAYAEFIESEEVKPERYERTLRMARSQGYWPLDYQNFVSFYIAFLKEFWEGEAVGEDTAAPN